MRLHRLVVLATLLAVAAGCGAEDADTAPGAEIAAEVDRIGGLLDDGHTCEALEATRTVEVLADRDDVRVEVREAVHAYLRRARTELTCERTPSPTPTTPTQDADEGNGEGRDGDEDDEDDEDDDRPGRGRGRGNGNGNGNDD